MAQAGKNEAKWQSNYEQLKAFIEENGHLPNKKKIDNRKLLNWWKYNQKLAHQGKLSEAREELLKHLGNMRSSI